MPELTDDHIEELFADLRATEMRQVRPPGATAARTTVRRRRTVQSVAAGVAVLVVAGGVATASLQGPGDTTGIAGTHQDNAPLSAAEQQRYKDDAERVAIGLSSATGRSSGVVFLNDANGANIRDESTAAGNYLIAASCAGFGTVTLTVTAVPADDADVNAGTVLASEEVPCSTALAQRTSVVVTLPARQSLDVLLAPAPDAIGRAAAAFQVADA